MELLLKILGLGKMEGKNVVLLFLSTKKGKSKMLSLGKLCLSTKSLGSTP